MTTGCRQNLGQGIADRVKLSARLLEGELHRASPLHAIRRDKGLGEARPDEDIYLPLPEAADHRP